MTTPTRSQLQAEIDQLRSQLTAATAPIATDPNMSSIEVDNTPAIASPTAGDHRMTFVVPHPDDSVVSIGKAGPSNRITDTGITGRTKTHIHWHTTDAPAPSMLLLGGGSTIPLTGYPGVSNTAANNGFMVVTNGHSYIDAQQQFLVTAREKDLVLRTIANKYAILQSDAGSSELNAKKSVTVHGGEAVFISAADYNPQTINYADDWIEKAHDESLHMDAKNATKGMDVAQSAISLVTGLKKTWKKAKKLKGGEFSEESVWGVAKYLADAIKLALTATRWANHTVPGQVKISGDTDVSISGGRQASMFGYQSASVSSLVSASLYGGTASVKGFLYASLFGGMDVSVKGYRTASLSSEFGKTKVTSKSDTEVNSEEGSVVVTGNTNVQLNANTGAATVHGVQESYVGAGKGSGYGMIVMSSELSLGAVSNPEKFDSVAMKGTCRLEMTDKKIEIKHGNAKITIQDDIIEMYAAASYGWKVDNNGNWQLEGSKMLFG